jgi:type I restriction enzyme S subunit
MTARECNSIACEPKDLQSHQRLQIGDILISMTGNVGRVCRVTEKNCLLNQRVGKLIPTAVDDATLFILLSQPSFIKAMTGVAKGGAQPNLSISEISDHRFCVPPPLPEQRAIATALSDVDGLLGALDRLIAKKRDLKQAAMQQLLTGQTRLPGFKGEWRDTTLGEIGECIIGLTYKPENVVKHGLLVLRSSNVQNGRLDYDDNVYVNLEVSEHLYTQVGDLLICVRNGSRALIGKCAVIDQAAAGLTFGAFMAMYRTRHWRFVVHAFQGDDIQRQIRDNIGATINQITNKDMKAFRIKLPPGDEQTAIASVLSEMDAELTALEQRRDKTRALKQGMMQELLTGRTRLVG